MTADRTTSGAPPQPPGRDEVRRTIDAVFRLESPRLIAGLARIVGDVGLAEELAQDAMVAALEQWPATGIPANPGAWLMAVGRRRGVDTIRRSRTYQAKLAQIGRQQQIDGEGSPREPDLADLVGAAPIADDMVRLIVTACHPALTVDAQVTMVLRLLAGLSTAEIARAYMTAEPTVAQRISRAKRTLRDARVTFEAPSADEVSERLPAVLRVIYLIFNEGYTATRGSSWTRPDLCHEALRLARLVQGLVPGESEAHGLAALLELQASRLPARIGPHGEPILLDEQNRARWDPLLIRRGLAALRRAEALGGAYRNYTVQAAIAACHAGAARAADTDWPRIAQLYGVLAEITPSPIVELNRAVAVSRASGPDAGLAVLEPLRDLPALRGNHLLPSVRADLLTRLGRHREAGAELRRAADLAGNEAERELLLARARALAGMRDGVSAGRPRSDS